MNPPAPDLTRLDATAINDLFVRGEASAREITRAHLDRIEATEPSIHAFLAVLSEAALARAGELDAARARGDRGGPLAGVPIAVKDIIAVSGAPTTCGSRILETWRSPYEATCVRRLREAGAVLLGKTNMDEFAMGSSTEHSAFGPTRNPWALDRVPGGSSGGSAAAVAARQVPAAIGTDTGGSIRQPASFTGTVGLKPTYGRVSRFGLIAFASSLDQAGCLTRSVRDAGRVLAAIAGHDPQDMTSAPRGVDDVAAAAGGAGDPGDLAVGVPVEAFGPGLDAQTAAAVRGAVERMRSAGVTVREVSLPSLEIAVASYYIIATAEASSNLARYDGVRYGRREAGGGALREMYEATRGAGFGPEVKRRIMLGTYVLSAGYYDAYYMQAMSARARIRADFEAALDGVDLLVMPTTPTPAFRIGEKVDDPLAMYLSDTYTVTANLSGLPAISVPCGFTSDGLPIGCQILGRAFGEAALLRAAALIEADRDGADGPVPELDRAGAP